MFLNLVHNYTILPLSVTLFALFFLALVFLHAASLRRLIPWSFSAHLLVMGVLWAAWNGWVAYLAFSLPVGRQFPASVRFLGLLFIVAGVATILWHRFILGRERFFGGRSFTPAWETRTQRGLYHYIKHPVYDAMLVIFLGLWLWRGQSAFLGLAVLSLILLNIILVKIER